MAILAIVGDSYRDEQRELLADPIIIQMAGEVFNAVETGQMKMDELVHGWSESAGPPKTPRHEFMSSSLNEYKARGGSKSRTIGGPANAVMTLVFDLRGESE